MAERGYETAFFNLPPEIRNKIYGLVFPCQNRKAYNPVLHYRRLEPCVCFKQPLMLVSRQMRNESVSLHYSHHEFHFQMFPPNKAILLLWLDNIAQDSISYIRRFQVKRYVPGYVHYHGERIMTIAVDLDDEESEMQIRVAGKEGPLPEALDGLAAGLPRMDGRQALSKQKLLELFEAVGWR